MNISYHPITEKEVNEWYCDLKFENILHHVYYDIVKKGRLFNLDQERLKAYVAIMKMAAQNAQNQTVFDQAHAYNIALVQGLFRKYFYLQEFSFSKLILEKNYFERYTKKWDEFVNEKITMQTHNRICGDKSGGVFIPDYKVIELLQDIKVKGSVQEDIKRFFGDHLELFINALEFAKQNKTGLLEASGIISEEVLNAHTDLSAYVIENCDDLSLEFTTEKTQKAIKEENISLNSLEGNKDKSIEKTTQAKKSLWKKFLDKL